ncbi:MAG: flagella basal body P-ring formation protein FlgA [Edaphobacter sp.]
MFQTASPHPAKADSLGYRVTMIRWDPVLRQSWARVASCGHPEWPEVSVRATTLAGPARQSSRRGVEVFPLALVVRAGDVVRLWRQEQEMRLEVTGVAEESGGLGSRIRVRLLRRETDEPSQEEQFTGIVRGPSNVEMLP